MAHNVICYYCKKSFDRDREEYAKVNSRRYAHASCVLREQYLHPELPKLEIIDPTDEVECIYCKQKFKKSKEPYKVFSNGKYAHEKCFEIEQNRELTDAEKLDKYIMKLYNIDHILPRIKQQIKKYIEEYGYTYSGIMKALIYYYEIKGNKFDFAKTNGGIGIVPFVYEKAYNYYYSIWEAQQAQQRQLSESSSIDVYIPKTIEVHIPIPQREERKRKLFTFLDEEEEEEENN